MRVAIMKNKYFITGNFDFHQQTILKGFEKTFEDFFVRL